MNKMTTIKLANNSGLFIKTLGNSIENRLKTTKSTLATVQDLPGPKPSLPFVGTGWQYFKLIGIYDIRQLHKALIDKFNKYGPIYKEEYQWNKPIVYISDPKDIEAVFRAQGKCPIRPTNEFVVHYRNQHKDRYNSVGIVNLNGVEWYQTRQMLAPALLKMDVIHNFVPDLDNICKDFIELIERQKCFDNSIKGFVIKDFRDISYNFVFESISWWCLNKRLGCLDPNVGSSITKDGPILINATKRLFESYQKLFYSTELWKYFKTKAYRQLEDSENTIYETLSKYVDSVITPESNSSHDLMNELFKLKTLSAKDIKVTLMDFIVGGLFTVSNALNFVCYHLANNQDVQKRLFEEVSEAMNGGNEITVEKLSRMPYLKACVKESFRLTPTIPGIVRVLPTDLCLSGYHIPKGTLVFANSMTTCRSDKYFSEPNTFMPERWIGEARHRSHPFSVLPFGFGNRMCIGKHFALLHIQMAVLSIINRYKLSVEKTDEIDMICDFLIVPNREIRLHIENRI